jgi:hypothetical protein
MYNRDSRFTEKFINVRYRLSEELKVQNLITVIIIALLVYLIFFRRVRNNGMGCCGGHNARDFKGNRNSYKETYPHERLEDVIDLSEDDYTVLPSRDEKIS